MIYKIFILSFSLLSFIFPQSIKDSVNYENNELSTLHLSSIHTDWNIINSPLLFYPMNTLESSNAHNPSLYRLFTDSQINTGLNLVKPEDMLNQFQLANNWEAKKKYGVFAKYLGIAQFMGVIGLAVIHINKFHMPKKKNSKPIKPSKEIP